MDFMIGGSLVGPSKASAGVLSRLLGWLFGRGATKAPSAIEAVAAGFGTKNAAIFERRAQIVSEKGGKTFVDHLGALAQAVGEKVPIGQVWKLGELGGKPIFGAVRNGLGIVETQAGTMIVHAPTGGTPTILGPLIP